MKSYKAFLAEQTIINIIVNFIIAYYLSSMALAGFSHIPLSAPSEHLLAPNIAGDLLVGTIIMGIIITLITTAVTRHKLRHNKTPLGLFEASYISEKLPNSIIKRSIVLSLLATVLIALPIILILTALAIHQVSSADYIIYHACYAAILAGFFSYIAVGSALSETSTDKLNIRNSKAQN